MESSRRRYSNDISERFIQNEMIRVGNSESIVIDERNRSEHAKRFRDKKEFESMLERSNIQRKKDLATMKKRKNSIKLYDMDEDEINYVDKVYIMKKH